MLDSSRPIGGSCTHDLARPAGLLLCLERARASRQQHGDGAGDGDALCADRQLRCGRWQCAVPCSTGRVDQRRRLACGKAACSRDRVCRTSARTCALEPRLPSGLLPSCSGRYPLSGPRTHWVRRQSAARSRRSGSRTRCAGRARFLCTCRSVHDADGGACGYRAASGVLLRMSKPSRSDLRSAQMRNRTFSLGRPSLRRPGRHGPTPISFSTLPRVSALASISGTVMSMPLTDISLVRAASPWNSFEREPAGLRKPLTTHHAKHAARRRQGKPARLPDAIAENRILVRDLP